MEHKVFDRCVQNIMLAVLLLKETAAWMVEQVTQVEIVKRAQESVRHADCQSRGVLEGHTWSPGEEDSRYRL